MFSYGLNIYCRLNNSSWNVQKPYNLVVGWLRFCKEIKLCVFGGWILEDEGDNIVFAMMKGRDYCAEEKKKKERDVVEMVVHGEKKVGKERFFSGIFVIF